MKRLRVFILIMYSFPLLGTAQQVPKDSVLFEVLLGKEMLKSFENISFIPSIAITPEGFILLSSPNQFYILGAGGMLPLSEKTEAPIHSFAKTPDNAIMLVREKDFCFMDSSGKIVKLFGLPDDNMNISAGKEVLYLYGKNSSTGKDIIYLLFKGGKYVSLLEYPTPIASVLEINGGLFFSSKNKILLVDIASKQVNELLSLPNEKDEVISLCNDFVHGILYFSTNQAVYRVKNDQIELVGDALGGILKYDGDGLLVFNPGKSMIVQFRNTILYPSEIK